MLAVYNRDSEAFEYPLDFISDAAEIEISRELNADYSLKFNIPIDSPSRYLVKKLNVIECLGQLFRIQSINKAKDKRPIFEVDCLHISSDMQRTHIPSTTQWSGASPTGDLLSTTPKEIMTLALYGTNFHVMTESELSALGMVWENTVLDFWYMSKTNPLEIINRIRDLIGRGDIYVDNFNTALVRQVGKQTGQTLEVGYNLSYIKENGTADQLVTRLYCYGADDMPITSVYPTPYIDSPDIEKLGIYEGFYYRNDIDEPSALLKAAQWEFDSSNPNRKDQFNTTYSCGYTDPEKAFGMDVNTQMPFSVGDFVQIKDKDLEIDEEQIIRTIQWYPFVGKQTTLTVGRLPYTQGQLLAYSKKAADIVDMNVDKHYGLVDEVLVEQQVENTTTTIINEKVISAETAMLLNAWIKYLMVEYLETNFDSIDVRQPFPENGERNFIRIQGQQIGFFNSQLSNIEREDYKTPFGDQVYWSAIDGEDAYKYFTISDPVSINAEIQKKLPEEQETYRELHKVRIRKATSTVCRLLETFDETHPDKIPIKIWGSGDLSGKGKAYEYKDRDGFYLLYDLPVGVKNTPVGTRIGIKITNDGVFYYDLVENGWKLIGGGSGNVTGHLALDHQPTQAELNALENGVLISVYDTSKPYIPS